MLLTRQEWGKHFESTGISANYLFAMSEKNLEEHCNFLFNSGLLINLQNKILIIIFIQILDSTNIRMKILVYLAKFNINKKNIIEQKSKINKRKKKGKEKSNLS
jgi:hypothetical protein